MSYFSSQKNNRNAFHNIPLNINSSKTADINADKAANNIFENCNLNSGNIFISSIEIKKINKIR